jgi:putative ABC transport system permease protein
VAVIGSEVAKEFFPLEDPIGQTIRIDTRPFTVVGVASPVGFSGGAGGTLIGRDLNLDVYIPMTTARVAFSDIIRRSSGGTFSFEDVQISEIIIQSPSRERVAVDADRVRRIMDTRHPGLTDIGIIVPYELLAQARRTALTGQIVSAFIAAISLLVGGIGIMNIMLASVTERTREIGIRRAVGATRRQILAQFLVETSVLTSLGGILGVALGVGFSVFIDRVVPWLPGVPVIGRMLPPDVSLPTQVTLWSIAVAFSVAALTGLIFGIYPARKAARQDPIVALRHD